MRWTDLSPSLLRLVAGLAMEPSRLGEFVDRPAHTARVLGLTYREFSESLAELETLGGGTEHDRLRAALVVLLGDEPPGVWSGDG